jgi:RNA polymerase sigma factor (sigma-70 family)
MTMTESQQLLAEYVRNGSEEAFEELVTGYIDLVYSTAFRLVEGDAHRARDVAQTVFADLARMAPRLSPNSMLGGWLHRRACFVARTVMRGERRRQARERQAVEMSALENLPDTALAEIAPVLDEAIDELGADDRDAVLLRFFEQRSLRSVGEALGTSENVAQKRVARAVQELALLLKRRGYTLPAATLASGLAAGAVKAAPAGLAVALAKGALAGSASSGGIAAASARTAGLAKLKVGIAAILVLGGVAIFWRGHPGRGNRPAQQQPSQSKVAEQPGNAPRTGSDTRGRLPVASAEPAAGPQPAVEPVAVATPAPPRMVPEPRPATPTTLFGNALLRRFYSQPGSRVRIEGTNNANGLAWQAESTAIEGFLEYSGDYATGGGSKRGQISARGQVDVPIHSIKSVDNEGRPYSDAFDAAWYAALKATDNPGAKVTFYLSALARREPVTTNRAKQIFEASGDLVMVGVTNRMTMPLRILPLVGDQLQISGKTSVRWVSEGVDPFSIIADDGPFSPDPTVTVKFEWRLAPTNTPVAAAPKGTVPLYLELPAPAYRGLPPDLPLSSYVEPFPEMPRPLLLVPPGLTNLAQNALVTSSDKNATPQTLAKIIDGNKDGAEASIIYLRKGTQWVQLDLGGPRQIFAIALWHAHNAAKVYHDVIVQVADDPDLTDKVRTLFNNDQDNSSGLGKDRDLEYFETYEGKLIDAKGVEGRFLRFYSKGSTESALNEYTEIEVYGRPPPP